VILLCVFPLLLMNLTGLYMYLFTQEQQHAVCYVNSYTEKTHSFR